MWSSYSWINWLSFVSQHNMWWHYGLVCCFCPLVSTLCGGIMVWFVVGFVVSKHYVVVLLLDLTLLSVSEHNMWSYYGWVCRCRSSVSTIYGCILVGFVDVVRQ